MFKAVFDNGVVIEWEGAQRWKRVFSDFKLTGTVDGHGVLFVNDCAIRETGSREV